MASKAMQEEKNQKILRNLLSIPENKRCADCTAKGPVYVNTTHYTFICTACSGIHREFNHRVKSISMATFKAEEIKSLQDLGNKAAREKYLARWTPEEFPEPDPSDKERVRQFINLKYDVKKWVADGGKSQASTTSHEKKITNQNQTPEFGVRIEPLQSIIGSNIPPIKFEFETQPKGNNQKKSQTSQSNLVETGFTQDNPISPSHSQPSDSFFSSPFPNQVPVQPTTKPVVPVQDKASELKAQLGSIYQQQAQLQQNTLMMQIPQNTMMPGMMPGMMPQMMPQMMHGMMPQMSNNQFQQASQTQQIPVSNVQIAQIQLQQMMMSNPQLSQQIQANPQYGQQILLQIINSIPNNQVHSVMQMPQTPVQQLPGAAWGSPVSAAPEPEKKDPFASFSLSNLSKQTTPPKIGNNADQSKGIAMGNTINSTPIPTTKQDDSFGFSTSPVKPSGVDFGFPSSNGKDHKNSTKIDEFDPFGVSQSHVMNTTSQQTRPQPPTEFNPFSLL